MKKIFLFIAVLMCSCNEKPTEKDDGKLQRLSWLQGDWKMETPNGMLLENWKIITDNEWSGTGTLIAVNGDTPFIEKIRLVQEDTTLWYIPAVSNQNEGKEVRFREKEFSQNKIVFENAAHDFPQRIIYSKTSDSTIEARIEGNTNGKETSEAYIFKRQ